MTDYDDLFDATAPNDSVFADKSALDPLAEPDDVVARRPRTPIGMVVKRDS